MAEYDLVCDACGDVLLPHEAVLSWHEDHEGKREGDFALTHEAHAPRDANARREGRTLVWPNGYLRFFGERFERVAEGWTTDGAAIGALLLALAPFVVRSDTPAEMDNMRAASFGERLGVKPGEKAKAKEPAPADVEGGK